jgi:hypothetical protein
MVVVVAVAVAAPPEPARGDKKPKGAPAPFPPLAVAVFKGEVIGCALPALAVTDSPSPAKIWADPDCAILALDGHALRINPGGARRHKGQGKPGGPQQSRQERALQKATGSTAVNKNRR